MGFLGLCKFCGCPLYRDGPIEFEGVWCNHEVQTELDAEVTTIENAK
jgi:hypothetical protein